MMSSGRAHSGCVVRSCQERAEGSQSPLASLVPDARGGGRGGRLPWPWTKLRSGGGLPLMSFQFSLVFPGSLPRSTSQSGLLALKITTCYKNSFFLHLCALMF